MGLPFLAGLAIATVASLVAPIIAREIAKQTIEPSIRQQIEGNETIKQAIEEAKYEVRESTPGIDILPSKGKEFTTYDIPGAGIVYAKEVAKKTEQKLIQRGVSPKTAKKISKGVETLEFASGAGEAIGTVTVSGASEVLGAKVAGKLITRQVAKSGGKIALSVAKKQIPKQVLKASAVGGLYEGAVSTVISGIAREGKVEPGTIIMGAGLGAVTAGIGGYGLSRAYISKMKGAKVVDWVGQSLIDPYEKIGDVLGHHFVKEPTVPIITPTVTPTPSVTPSPSPSPSPTPSSTPSSTPSPSPTPTTTPTPTPTPTPSVTPSPSSSPSPVPSPSPTPIPEPEPSPTPEPTPTQTPTETPTPTPTVTPTPVPTPTPQPRIPPPLPMIPGRIPGELKGIIRKGKLYYYNELQRMRKVMSELMM